MYVPEAFVGADVDDAHALVEANAFGTLIASRDDGGVEIAHIPFGISGTGSATARVRAAPDRRVTGVPRSATLQMRLVA